MLDNASDQRLLGRKVVVERRDVDAGPRRHVAGAQALEALFGEQLESRQDQVLPALLGDLAGEAGHGPLNYLRTARCAVYWPTGSRSTSVIRATGHASARCAAFAAATLHWSSPLPTPCVMCARACSRRPISGRAAWPRRWPGTPGVPLSPAWAGWRRTRTSTMPRPRSESACSGPCGPDSWCSTFTA